MLLFYSGSKSAGGTQPYSWLSLGAYPSISQIKNGVKNSIFNDVTIQDIKEKKTVYRLISLMNTSGSIQTDVKIYTEKAVGCICKFEGALVSPAVDVNNQNVFETIENETDIPIAASFTDIDQIGNALTIASFAINEVIGIWLKKTIDDTNTNYFDNTGKFIFNSCTTLLEAHSNEDNFYNEKSDSFSIKIAY